MNDITTTVDTHLEAYAEPDPARRADLIAQVWLSDGELIDPPLEGKGHDGIGEMATAVLEHFPDHSFRRTSAVDEHHGFVRYGAGDAAAAAAPHLSRWRAR